MKKHQKSPSLLSLARSFFLTLLQRATVNLRVQSSFWRQRQRGASALEYALILAVIVVLIAVAVSTTGLGQKAADAFSNLADNFGA
jgi:Flp pilus assembly pilin Flp